MNSFELVQKLKNVSVPVNFILAFSCVVSFFTNIPKETKCANKTYNREIEMQVLTRNLSHFL